MLDQRELDNLWRTEQVLHALARIVREGILTEEDLGYEYLAVCACAEGVQALAARVQREKLEKDRA
jgi:hypothetical protein